MSPSKRIDAFGRRHPWLMVAGLLVLATLATLVLLYQFEAPALIYENF